MLRFKPHRFLFSPRRYLHGRNSVSRASGFWGRRQWVVARSLCLFKKFVLGDVPPADRMKALNVRIQQWSPFPQAGRYVTWEGSSALVWVWDDVLRQKAMSEAGLKSAPVIPETLLKPRQADGAVCLVSCLEGMEGQVWRNGRLAASHWWTDEPTPAEWARFLLDNDLDPSSPRPECRDFFWLPRPWAANSTGEGFKVFRREGVWLYFIAVLLLLFFVWQGVTIGRWHQAKLNLAKKVTARTSEIEPLLAARTTAMEERAVGEHLAALAPYPTQLELMAAVAEKLPSNQARLVEWKYTKGHLTFILSGQNLDPRYYVKAYQDYSFFTEVTAEKNTKPNELVVEMTVLPRGVRLS